MQASDELLNLLSKGFTMKQAKEKLGLTDSPKEKTETTPSAPAGPSGGAPGDKTGGEPAGANTPEDNKPKPGAPAWQPKPGG